MNVDIRKTDVELLERLSDAAMRGGHTQTAIQGYALALRLRLDLNLPGEFTYKWDENASLTIERRS